MKKLPEDKQKVYGLLSTGDIVTHHWSGNTVEQNMWRQGNIFETEDEAIKAKQKRVLEAMREQDKYTKAFLQIRSEGEKDFLVVDDRYIIDFEDLVKVCEEYQKCQKA